MLPRNDILVECMKVKFMVELIDFSLDQQLAHPKGDEANLTKNMLSEIWLVDIAAASASM